MHRIMAMASCPCRLSFRLLVPGEEGVRQGKMYIQKYGGCQLGSRSSSKRGLCRFLLPRRRPCISGLRHRTTKHGGWGRDLSLHLGPCGGDNPSALATRPFPILAAIMGGVGIIGSLESFWVCFAASLAQTLGGAHPAITATNMGGGVGIFLCASDLAAETTRRL